jgi:hypothetical protein
MSKQKSLCLHCQYIIAQPPYDALRCDLGKHVRTLNDPRLCHEYTPTQRRKAKVEEGEDPDQLILFELSVH